MDHDSGARNALATGGLIFAATMLIIIGIFQVLTGIAAVVRAQFFLLVGNSYAYQLSTVTWGWIHIVIGALVIVTGFALFSGSAWARAIGIAMASISAISYFFFVPYYPLWSLLVIALNIFAIWAMATAREPGRRGAAPGRSGTYEAGLDPGQRWTATNPAAYYGQSEQGRRAPDIAARSGAASGPGVVPAHEQQPSGSPAAGPGPYRPQHPAHGPQTPEPGHDQGGNPTSARG